ncbi:MAG: nitrate reductase cytochrome c-type subunit [Rhodospirillales bacterium]|nr:nitrate reductase cytochrome c-type subunit [Rhodospirillales bacterium]
MMKLIAAATAGMALLVGVVLWVPSALAQQESTLHSLRGVTSLDETNDVNDIKRLNTGRRFDRAYRQQPPLIPHKIDKYQVNLKVNQCMRCHDWPNNTREGAPKISETHYTNRNGVALDQVSNSRWFCTQCHVPQTNAPALVENTFESAVGLR